MPYLLLLLVSPLAAHAQNCGTLVLPTGIGISAGADITSLNPELSDSSYNADAANLMYSVLIWIDQDGRINWPRSLASAVTSPDQGTTYDVTLRPWHWSDGVPVTSGDVAYCLRLMNELGTDFPGYGAGGMPDIIKSFTITDATHFQVVLKRQVNPVWFIYNGLYQLTPLPEHSWGKYTLDQIWQNQSDPAFFSVTDGPLQVKRFDIGRDLVYVPNPAYDGPKMNFSKLVFNFLETDGATLQGIEAGELDAADVPLAVWNAVQHLPGIYLAKMPVSPDYNYIDLNFRNPRVAFFKDVRVRDAFADAIDQQQIINLAFHGLGIAIRAPLPPTPSSFLSPAMAAGNFPVGYDPAKARALLAQAGYTPGRDGIMQKAGQRLSFTDLMSADDAMIAQMTLLLQADLLKVGIEMKVRQVEFNQMLAALNSGGTGWQTAGLAINAGPFPSGEAEFQTGAFENTGGYSDPKMDSLINDSINKPGLNALYTYENYASAQQPVIFYARERVAVLVRDRLHGLEDGFDTQNGYAPDLLYCTGGKGPQA